MKLQIKAQQNASKMTEVRDVEKCYNQVALCSQI